MSCTPMSQLDCPSLDTKYAWITAKVKIREAKGSKSKVKGRPMAQPASTQTGSTKMAICEQQSFQNLHGLITRLSLGGADGNRYSHCTCSETTSRLAPARPHPHLDG